MLRAPFERMQPARVAPWVVAVVILGTLVLAGPVGGLDVTAEPQRLGDGTATVTDVDLHRALTVASGRFGTRRTYARGPTASVAVQSVTGTPRVVLRVQVPALEYDAAATRLLGERPRGRVRLSIRDRAFEPAALEEIEEEVVVRTTVRVQSFDGNRVVFARNRTVEVPR